MAKCKQLMLKHSEIEYVLSLVEANKEEGVYWGRKDYFIDRQERVIGKLKVALNTKG